jgi:hypothetical protein
VKKKIFNVGVVLLFGFLLAAILVHTPDIFQQRYEAFDVLSGNTNSAMPYDGINYTLSDVNLTFSASLGDTVQLVVLANGEQGNLATAFLEKSDGTPIFGYETAESFPATHIMSVGTDLPYSKGNNNYVVQLGVPQQDLSNGAWSAGEHGIYSIKVAVYSSVLSLALWIVEIILLIAGGLMLLVSWALDKN